MWTMDADCDMNMKMLESYSSNTTGTGRKLRPLFPRPPPPPPPPTPPTSSSSSSYCHRPFHLNNHLAGEQMVVVSSRWNPTPEQLQTLEELYRRGTRTPSADEIQQITAQLRLYGKIEGKNVFYWFQNHKARERQKRRRQLIDINPPLHQPPFSFTTSDGDIIHQSLQRNDSAELEETRNWAIPTFSEVRERRRKAEATEDRRWIFVEEEEGQEEEEEEEEEEEDRNDELLLVHRRRKSYISPPAHHAVVRHETLELFPVNREQPEKCLNHDDVNLSPPHFIEFLPLKK